MGSTITTQVWRGNLPHGADALLSLEIDGSFQLVEEPSSRKRLLSCFSPLKINAAPEDVVGAILTSDRSLQIYHMPITNSKAQRVVRSLHKTPHLEFSSPDTAAQVLTAIRSSVSPHPKRVLAIINPASGPGAAPRLYRRRVAPVLKAAGFCTIEHTTSARGHATDILQSMNPEDIDLIISLGGDGTLFEVLQGVLNRPDWEIMSKIPLLQVPCGSGNALAASTGLWDVSTAVHAAIKGELAPLDISSVVQISGGRFFSFLSFTYGIISTLDVGTEHLRMLGELRFVIGGVQQVIRQHTYKIKVAYLDADDDLGDDVAGEVQSGVPGRGGGAAPNLNSLPGRGGEGADDVEGDGSNRTLVEERWEGIEEKLGEGPCLLYLKEFSSVAARRAAVCTGKSGRREGNGNASNRCAATSTTTNVEETSLLETSLVETSASFGDSPQQLHHRDRANTLTYLPNHWHWMPASEIQVFAACNLPHLASNFHFAPEALPHSGHLNLIFTSGKAGRKRGMELLTASEKGHHMHLVQQRKVKAIWVEPQGTGTWLLVDGEQVPHEPMYAEVHPGLCTVLKPPQRSRISRVGRGGEGVAVDSV